MMSKRAVIFANGNLPSAKLVKKVIKDNDFIICVDGGTENALKTGVNPQVIIGDFDSFQVDKDNSFGVRLIKYPPEKNETDFELAVNYAIKKGFKDLTFFGVFGSRIDHSFSSILFLARVLTLNALKIKIYEGNDVIYITNKNIKLTGQKGDFVSLIPLTPKVKKIILSGMKYPLVNQDLSFGQGRGVSNIIIKSPVEIKFRKGVLMAVHNPSYR